MSEVVRTFNSGATRDTEQGKLDFEGFNSPLVVNRFAEYMDSHRKLPDGTLRDSDNWQKGIPLDVYMKSLWRHFHDMWLEHRGYKSREDIEKAICGILFNANGYLHEVLRERGYLQEKIILAEFDELPGDAQAPEVPPGNVEVFNDQGVSVGYAPENEVWDPLFVSEAARHGKTPKEYFDEVFVDDAFVAEPPPAVQETAPEGAVDRLKRMFGWQAISGAYSKQ